MQLDEQNSLGKVLLKNSPWLAAIIFFIVWALFDLTYNVLSPLENSSILIGHLLIDGIDFEASVITGASIFSSYIFGISHLIGGVPAYRIVALVLSLFSMLFFYKFAALLLEDKIAAVFSLIFLALQSSFMFISKQATNDIISFTFFTAFIWLVTYTIKSDKSDKKIMILSVLSITLLYFSILSNYILILFIPFILIILIAIKQKKLLILFAIMIVLLVLNILVNEQMLESLTIIFSKQNEHVSFLKVIVRLAEYMAIPMMLIFAAQQMIWKTHIKSSLLWTFFLLSLLLPIYMIITVDIYNMYRYIPYSILFLSPFCGLILRKFLLINRQYKFASIFFFYFLTLISMWQLSKLQEAYPNTDNLMQFISKNISQESIVYSEEPFLLSNHFYPEIDITQFYNTCKKLAISNSLSTEKSIKELISDGDFEIIVLNSMHHPELNERLKKSSLRYKYRKAFGESYRCTSLFSKKTEIVYEVYILKDLYRIEKQFLAKR